MRWRKTQDEASTWWLKNESPYSSPWYLMFFQLRDSVSHWSASKWATIYFGLTILLQRFAVPGLPLSLSVVFTVLFVATLLVLKVVELDRRRFTLWVGASGATAITVLLQSGLVKAPIISLTSWGLMFATLLPSVVHFRNRSEPEYEHGLQGIARVSTWLAGASVLFLVTQFMGLPYKDWFATVVPKSMQMSGFVISYPLSYESQIYKSNAWIGLEPSFIAFMLGLGALAALLSGASPFRIAFILAGMGCTMSGSGVAVFLVGLLVLIGRGQVSALRAFAIPGVLAVSAVMMTPAGQSLLSRSTEINKSNSSTSLRATQAYIQLWPTWIENPASIFFGRGAGSSQRLLEATGIEGLLAPTLVKIFFDYGLLAGAIFFALVFHLFIAGPRREVATALAFSMFTLQPIAATFVACCLVATTWWSPRLRNPGFAHGLTPDIVRPRPQIPPLKGKS